MSDETGAIPEAWKGLSVVVDTNQLARDELLWFLKLSPDNRAILPDYVAMERFKPDDLNHLYAAFSPLKPFAHQVMILKSTGEVSRLNPDVDALPADLIDADQTEAFPDFLDQLERAAAGDDRVVRQLRDRAGWAQAQMSVVLEGASNFPIDLAEFEQFFTKRDIAYIRSGKILTNEMNAKFDLAVGNIAQALFENAPTRLTPPDPATWPQHFILRNALCHGVYMLAFVRRGIGARRPEKARNDVIDVLLATYGTYFNGVMSEDALTNEVHHLARYILDPKRVTLPPDYLELLSRANSGSD